MAILVEQEKKISNAPSFFGWLIMAILVLGGAYYVFFATPPAVIVTPPPNYAVIAPIAQINFDPASVINSPGFQALKAYIPEPTSTGPTAVGRANPFIAP